MLAGRTDVLAPLCRQCSVTYWEHDELLGCVGFGVSAWAGFSIETLAISIARIEHVRAR